MTNSEIVNKIYDICAEATEDIGKEFSKNTGLPTSSSMVQELATNIGFGLLYKYAAASVWYKISSSLSTTTQFENLNDIMDKFADKVFTDHFAFRSAITSTSKEEWNNLIKGDKQTYSILKDYISRIDQIIDTIDYDQ